MNEPDFEAYAALWRQEPGEEEVRIFRGLVARTGRGARLLRWGEAALGIALVIGLAGIFVVMPSLLVGVIATLLAAAILWSAWMRHRLAREEAILSRRDRHALLDTLERSARASLHRSTVGLVLAVPGWGLAMLLAAQLDGGTGSWASLLSARALPSALFIILFMALLVRRNRRLRAEVARAEALRRAYREEDSSIGRSHTGVNEEGKLFIYHSD